MNKRISLLLAIVLVFTLVGSFSGIARAQDKVLTVAFAQEPDTMNGYYSAMAFGQWAMDLVAASLWDYDKNAQPVLVLAAEIPTVENGGISADLKTYTVKLKPDLKWSDGEALTADDLKFTLDMIADKANEFAQATALQSQIVSSEIVDPTTVKVVWNDPQPFPEQLLSNIGLVAVLPKHVYEPIYNESKTIKDAPENQNPTVFSGPYVLKEWIRGESLTFEANPNYVNGAPKIPSLVIRIFPDPESGFAAVAAGQVDFQPNLGPTDGTKVKNMAPSNEVVAVFGGYIEYLVFNVRDDSFGTEAGPVALRDVNVRRAVRLAIDRRAINHDLLADAAGVTDSLYVGTQWENKDLGFVESDPEAAGKLLDEAGYKLGADGVRVNDKGEKLEWRYSTTTAQWRKDIQAVIQQQLEKVGIKIILENYPSSDFFGQWSNGGILATGNYALGEFANNTVLTNIVNVTADESLGCDQIPGNPPLNPAGNNHTGWCNKEFDSLIDITKTESDPAKALEAGNKAQVILRDEVPLITLFPRGDIYVYNKDRFTAPLNIGSGVGNQWYDIVNWELK
ncbi:MAG: peptide ABC transporter substrate-binding protein [Anaerolineae bacterium]|nr:peptide ABC transporter substrate-binding protein [Anaerolineae bacterium]